MSFANTSGLVSLLNRLSPAQFLVISYTLVIAVGTLLLRLPAASVAPDSLTIIDSLFLATSAMCVTGLTTLPISTELTVFGQLVILALLQMGALGLMTMSTLFALILGRRIGLRNRIMLQEDLNQNYLAGVVRLVRHIVVLTLIVEAAGTILLFFSFRAEMEPLQALYFAAFHAVSAFANAGFDLFGTSFEGYYANPSVLLTIAALFILGGLGFSVIQELLALPRERRIRSLHARLVLITTGALIILSWTLLFAFEYGNPDTIGSMTRIQRSVAAFFTAVTTRTAGFNVVATAHLTSASLFFVLLLMFIGASPGSTGGGIKTTTFVTLLLGTYHTIRGRQDISVSGRRLGRSQVDKAWAIVTLSLTWVAAVTILLLQTEGAEFLPTVFETVSAFGTVGLSMGITPELTNVGRVAITATMFLGRLGPMTLALALGQRGLTQEALRLPEERISLG